MPSNPQKGNVIKMLREITRRRNQIVHESDIYRKTKAHKITQREITHSKVLQYKNWINEFVYAINEVVKEI